MGHFKLLKSSDADRLEVEQMKRWSDFARTVLIGWDDKDIQDEDGNPLRYSDEARDRLLDEAPVTRAVIEAYNKAVDKNPAAKN
jgi:hypothetical protein